MATVFTKIIEGELPGRFVWRDDRCVAFLTINPVQPGHTLVVPVAEVDHWIDLDEDLAQHLMLVARKVGIAQQEAFSPVRVGMLVAGFEVPHAHLHVIPIGDMDDLELGNARETSAEDLDDAAEALRDALGTSHLS